MKSKKRKEIYRRKVIQDPENVQKVMTSIDKYLFPIKRELLNESPLIKRFKDFN